MPRTTRRSATMPTRKYVKYVADGGYRYGFNGQEKETAEGSSIDYGARVYDVRIGRWLSIDAYNSYYPSNSVYCHSICSPINFYDSNGFFVRNSNTGNIIFCIDAEFWLPSYDYENVFNGPFFAAYKGTILTNQGTKIEAYLSYDGKVYDKMPLIIENGKSKYNQNMKPIEGNSVYNCTGNAMAMQKLNIDNRIITKKILEEEGFKEIKESELQENDIVTYVKDGIIQHFELITVFINEDGTKELRCSGKGGNQNPSDYMDKPYGKNPNYKDCDVKFYSKQSPDFKVPLRILETKGGVDIVDPNVMKQLQNYVKNKNQQSEK